MQQVFHSKTEILSKFDLFFVAFSRQKATIICLSLIFGT